MKLILLHVLLALSPSETHASLLDWLPANAQTVVVVNDFEHSWEVYQTGERRRSGNAFQERFALEPGEVADLVVGEFLRAELIEPDGATAEVAIARIGADIDNGLKKIHGRLERQRAEVTVKSFGSHQGSIITRQGEDGVPHVSVHLVHDGRILLADSIAAANSIVTQFDAADRNGLAKQRGFAEVWKKCSPQLSGEAPAIAWYTDPWLKARSRDQQAGNHVDGGEAYLFAKRHGTTGIIGLGGSIVFGESGAQTVQAFAYAPKPLTSSMQTATHLTGISNLTIPAWVSKTVSEVVVLHANVDQALEHAGLLFDDGFAEGVEGTYDEVLLDLKDLLELDVKKDLYPYLGPRVYLLHGAAENRAWQPLLVAFEVQQADRVAEILRILVADDPEATEVVLADASDRVWRVPGKRGGRDFVLGMLKGVAVYSNDLEFAKAAMRFDESEVLLTADQLVALRDRAAEGIDALPSILMVKKPSSEDQASIAHPLDLVFQGTRFFAAREAQDADSIPWLPRRLTILLARHELVVGFHEKDGWKFVARTDAQTASYQNAP